MARMFGWHVASDRRGFVFDDLRGGEVVVSRATARAEYVPEGRATRLGELGRFLREAPLPDFPGRDDGSDAAGDDGSDAAGDDDRFDARFGVDSDDDSESDASESDASESDASENSGGDEDTEDVGRGKDTAEPAAEEDLDELLAGL